MQIFNLAFSWKLTLITSQIFDIENDSVILLNVFSLFYFNRYSFFFKNCSFENSSDSSKFLSIIYSLNSDLFLYNVYFFNITLSFSSLLTFDGGNNIKILNISNCDFYNISDLSTYMKNSEKAMIKISNTNNPIMFSSVHFTNLAASKTS